MLMFCLIGSKDYGDEGVFVHVIVENCCFCIICVCLCVFSFLLDVRRARILHPLENKLNDKFSTIQKQITRIVSKPN